jgi:amino acid transporter
MKDSFMALYKHFTVWKTCLFSIFIIPILAIGSATDAAVFDNPIKAKSFPQLLDAVAKAIITIAVPLAVVAIIIVGLRFIIAGSKGDQSELKNARQIFWWVVIGTAIVVGGALLVRAVVNTVESLGS